MVMSRGTVLKKDGSASMQWQKKRGDKNTTAVVSLLGLPEEKQTSEYIH
jgi:hypothetical protein